jgi:hypothetical protein
LNSFTGKNHETSLVYDNLKRYLELYIAPQTSSQTIVNEGANNFGPYFKLESPINASTFRSTLAAQYYLTDGSIAEQIGGIFIRSKKFSSPYHMIMAGGNPGLGFSSTASRGPQSFFEILSGGGNLPCITLTGHSGMTADIFQIRKDGATTVGGNGTRTAGITQNGLADFTGLTLPPTTFANLPASPAVNTFATINNGPAFVAGNDADGTGSTKCLVQWNGTAWKMVLQLY